MGDCFVKNCYFPVFFFGDHEFFSLIKQIFFIHYTKNSKSLMLEVAKVTTIDTFFGQIPKKFDPTSS